MKYYAFINGEQKGPFSIDELFENDVRPSTYVWCKEMDDWQQAKTIPEIRDAFRTHVENNRAESQTQADTGGDVAQEEPDLSNVPQSFRGIVRRSGTIPGPPENTDPDTSQPPQVSMALAIISLLLCFFPTGIAAVIFTYRSQKTWQKAIQSDIPASKDKSDLRAKAHDYARLAKMWLGITVALGFICWTLIISYPIH